MSTKIWFTYKLRLHDKYSQVPRHMKRIVRHLNLMKKIESLFQDSYRKSEEKRTLFKCMFFINVHTLAFSIYRYASFYGYIQNSIPECPQFHPHLHSYIHLRTRESNWGENRRTQRNPTMTQGDSSKLNQKPSFYCAMLSSFITKWQTGHLQ